MAVVQPNGIVLYARLGGGYYPIACSKDVNINTDSGSIETAPKTNGLWRTYEYERLTGSITGTGLVQVVSDANKYNILNIWNYQFSQLPVLCKFELTDSDSNTSVYECSCLVENVSITGSATNAASFSYTLKINGTVSNSTTPTSGGTTVDSWDYTEASGGTTIIGAAELIGADVLLVDRNGIGLQVITAGTPDNNQVLFTSGTGQLEFGYALGVDEYILVVYVS
jgi:hypothetical protein